VPAAVLDERSFALIEDLREVDDVSLPGRHPEVNEEQAQNRLDADTACRDVHAAVNGSRWYVQVGVAAKARVSEAIRVPVPADQLCSGVVQKVVSVCGRAHAPALAAILDDLELMAEDELDGPDAGRGEPQRVFG